MTGIDLDRLSPEAKNEVLRLVDEAEAEQLLQEETEDILGYVGYVRIAKDLAIEIYQDLTKAGLDQETCNASAYTIIDSIGTYFAKKMGGFDCGD